MEKKSSDRFVEGHRGVHLYHASMSNCSQRVRMVLEEKGIEWVSHLLDLSADDQLEASYQAINPKGVVPALVHDGKVIVESNDIITYIERKFDGECLVPAGEKYKDTEDDLINESTNIQSSIKLITFTYIFGDSYRKSPDAMAAYEKRQGNKELVEWHRRFSKSGFTDAETNSALTAFKDSLVKINSVLKTQEWLSGAAFGIADISWIVNAHRAVNLDRKCPGLIGIAKLEAVMGWYKKVSERESFRKAILAYGPGGNTIRN